MAQLSAFEQWWLDTWPHRWRINRYVPAFLRACPEPFRGQVLEVGAGSGWTSRAILEAFPQVELTATDIDPAATLKFERLQGQYGGRLKVQEADGLNLPFDRASFDVVVAFYMMHHIDDVARAVQQFMRVLRPGGWLGIADNRMSKKDIVDRVAAEASIKVTGGKGNFYVWAQKAHPF